MNARLLAAALVFAALAALRPGFTSRGIATPSPVTSMAWPAEFEGVALVPSELLPVERRLAAGFPGEVAAFEAHGARVVVRRIAQATRQVHPIAGCLKAGGFTVHPAPAWRHPQSGLWGVVHAEKNGRLFRVRERICSADGAHAWTDVSAWYWDAWLHPVRGPWTATVVIEPIRSR